MIHPLNRKELLITSELNRLNQLRDALSQASIDYQIRTKDLTSPTIMSTRGHRSTLGMDLSAHVEYKLYVQKADHSRAKTLL
ncbi:MAG: hypothetical protein IJZ66_05905 [Oscillibacter sp.]|nr:hypothetical protein [Oscillibacter sp.]